MTAVSLPQNCESARDARSTTKSRRRWWFRLAAVIVGLSPLLAAEGMCRLFDWGRPTLHDDPFVGFNPVPLFVLNDEGTRYEIPKSRQKFFCPESFPARKSAGDFRIFCLGGSTVQGRPFAIETSYTSWLEISLNAAQPDRNWDVINCGGVSYASYRLIPILREVLNYGANLIVLDTGHNEFLESRTFDHLQHRGELVNASLEAASQLRTFTLMREVYLRTQGKSSAAAPEGRPLLPAEVDALLDYKNGLEDYHRDEAWRAGVIEQFEFNLNAMIRIAREAGVEIVIVNPCSNIRDFAPFKSLHRDDLTPPQLETWEKLCVAGRAHMHGDAAELREAIACLEQACQIDPQHAATFYHLGHCYLAAHRTDDARRMFEKARDLDICPLRILPAMSESILRVAENTGTPLVDAQALYESRSRDGLVGDQWLVDHVHPSIAGHQLLADTLADQLIAMHVVVPGAGWAAQKERRYEEHLASLPDIYFLKGLQRLESEQHWAHGRATRIRQPSRR
jgi:tetratricopeptide (TPR) repeat protein